MKLIKLMMSMTLLVLVCFHLSIRSEDEDLAALLATADDTALLASAKDIEVVTPAPQPYPETQLSDKEFGLPIDFPIIGTVTLFPFKDEEGQSGLKGKLSDDKKIKFGPFSIDSFEVRLVKEGLGAVGQVTLFNGKGTCGFKKIVLDDAKHVKQFTLGISYTTKPKLPIPGFPIEIKATDVIVEQGKPLRLLCTAVLHDVPIKLGLILSKGAAGVFGILDGISLGQIIPFAENTPLAGLVIKSGSFEIEHMFPLQVETNKLRKISIDGVVDISKSIIGVEAKDVEFSCNSTDEITKGAIKLAKLSLPYIGSVEKAAIEFNFTDKTKDVVLTGLLPISIPDVGNIKVAVASHITKDGLQFSGTVAQEIQYGSIAIKDISVSYDKKSTALTFTGKTNIAGLLFVSQLTYGPDVKSPTQKTVSFSTQTTSANFMPFASSGIPILQHFGLTDLAAGVTVAKRDGKLNTQVAFVGDISFDGKKVRSAAKFISNDKGERGVLVNCPLPANWKISDAVSEFKGTIFDQLTIKQGELIACNINGTDPDTGAAVRKGLSIKAKVPLDGILAPINKLTGMKGQEVTVVGILDQDPRKTTLYLELSSGFAINSPVVSIGDTVFFISGAPELGIKTIVTVSMPGGKKLDFAGAFVLSEKDMTFGGTMKGDWKDPLFIKGLTVSNVSLALGVLYGSPTPTKLGIAGSMMIGKKTVQCAVMADAALEHMALEAKTDSLLLHDLTSFVTDQLHVSLPQQIIPNLKMENVYLRFAATDTTIGLTAIQRGMTFKGNVFVLGKKGSVEGRITAPGDGPLDETGFKLHGDIERIDLGPLKVTDEKGSGNPSLDIECTPKKQYVHITGKIAIGDIASAKSFIALDTSGVRFDFESELGGKSLLLAAIHGESSNPDAPQFVVTVSFKQKLKTFIKEQVTQALKVAKKGYEAGLNTAIAESNKAINTAKQKVKDAESKLDAIEKPIRDAQKEVDKIQGQINDLDRWYNGLPAF